MAGAMFDGSGAAWGLNAPPQFIHNLVLTWDALNARWNEWILGYGPDTQESFMEWLGMVDPDWQKMLLTLVAILIVLTALLSLLLTLRNRPPPRRQGRDSVRSLRARIEARAKRR